MKRGRRELGKPNKMTEPTSPSAALRAGESAGAGHPGGVALASDRVPIDVFLQPTDIIDSSNPAIAAAAADIVGEANDDEVVARRCFEWVRDHVRHSSDHRVSVVTCTASDVLKQRAGFCYAKSHLLAALLRTRGIPAALCYQRLSADGPGSGFVLHGLVAVHLKRHGWYRVDPRGNKPGVSCGFHPPIEGLPFTPKLSGEMDIPGRFADALTCVVATLRRWPTAAEVSENLPDYAPRV
jgi:transglutaminase-like putative cysteine protease